MDLKTNVSIVIPQFFYDFIARIIPGIFFILALCLELTYTGILTPVIQFFATNNAIISLWQGVLLFILAYITGLSLGVHRETFAKRYILLRLANHALYPYLSREKRVTEPNTIKLLQHIQESSRSFYYFNEKREIRSRKINLLKTVLDLLFQEIRLINLEAGYRLVKLRAEARMFHAVKNGMLFCLLLGVCMIFLFSQPLLIGLAKIILPAAIYFLFIACETHSYKHYYHSIICIHFLLQKTA